MLRRNIMQFRLKAGVRRRVQSVTKMGIRGTCCENETFHEYDILKNVEKGKYSLG